MKMWFTAALALLWARTSVAQGVASVCSETNSLALGDTLQVCIGIGKPTFSSGGTFKRAAFEVDVDEFSRMEVESSWQAAGSDMLVSAFGDDVTIHVEAGGKKSFQKLFRSMADGERRTFPYMTIIVELSDGEVENLIWDDGCHFCGGRNCKPATFDFEGNAVTEDFGDDCFLPDDDCLQGTSVAEACLLTVYVVFAGEDSNGIAMESSSLRFSRFRSGNLNDFAEDAESDFNSLTS